MSIKKNLVKATTSTTGTGTLLWETVEVQAVHIDKLLARIETLEARVTALGG